MKIVALVALPISLLLAACGSEPEVERETGDAGEAEGEVLGGSISDDMIPLDQLRSQSPPLREASTNGGGNASSTAPEEPTGSSEEPVDSAEAAEAAPPAEPAAEEG